MCHMSCVTCHVSHVMCHMSYVTCHVSHVMCHMSYVTCQVSHVMLGRVNFCQKHPNMPAEIFIVSLGALINYNKVQQDSSWSKFKIEFTIGITKTEYPQKGTF